MDPFFEDAVSDIEDAQAIRSVLAQVDALAPNATVADIGEERRRLARRQLQATFERVLLASYGKRKN